MHLLQPETLQLEIKRIALGGRDMNRGVFAVRNVADKLAKVAGSTDVLRFYWQTYFLGRIEKMEPHIYVISYPKCGRTWLRILLQNYLELADYTLQHFRDKSILGVQGQRIIKFDHDQGNWVPAPLPLQKLSFKTAKYSDKKIVFMVRDPRDVLVSSWYHLKYRERIYREGLSTFIRDDLVGVEKVVAFMNMWMENRYVPQDFFLLTYEQMHADTDATFTNVLEFMGIPVKPLLMQQAVEASTFTRMKAMESSGALREPWMNPGTVNLDKSMKVRQGKVGGYRDELSEADKVFLDAALRAHLCEALSIYIK